MSTSPAPLRFLPILAALCLVLALGWWAASRPLDGSLSRSKGATPEHTELERAPKGHGTATLQGRPRTEAPIDWDALPPLAEDEASILCRVIHAETGEPLPGVPVLATSQPRARGITGPDGRCELEVVPEWPYAVHLIVTGGDWVNAELVREGYEPPRDIAPWLAPVRAGRRVPYDVSVLPAAAVVGTVLDAEGRPAAGGTARIYIPSDPPFGAHGQRQFPWSLTGIAEVDAQGRFRLGGLPWGEGFRLLVHGPADVPVLSDRLALRPPQTTELTVRLPATRNARIRAVDAATHEPISGARLQVGRSAAPRRCGQRPVSDDEGWFALDPLAVDALFIRIEAYGYEVYRSWKITELGTDAWGVFGVAEDGVHEATIPVTPAARLAGTVEIEGALDAWKMVSVREVNPSHPSHHSAHIERDGTFRLTVPPGKRWLLEVATFGEIRIKAEPVEAVSGDEDVRLVARALTPEEFAAQESEKIEEIEEDEHEFDPAFVDTGVTWTVEGRVVDAAGSPVQGIQVAVSGRETHVGELHWSTHWGLSDADGRFLVRGNGDGPLEVQTRACGDRPVAAVVSAAPGASDILLRIPEGLTVRLQVRDEDGVPVAGAEARVFVMDREAGPATRDPPFGRPGRATGHGSVLLEGLTAGRAYKVRISGCTSEEWLSDVVLRDWQPRDEIVVLPRHRSVSGRVLSEKGEPVAGALVFLLGVEETYPDRARTDGEGRFEFGELRPGSVRLGACLPSLEPRYRHGLLRHETEAGDQDVILRLAIGRTLVVEVPGLDDLVSAWPQLLVSALGVPPRSVPLHRVRIDPEAGRVVVRGVKPGVRYAVWLPAWSHCAYREIDGRATEVTLRMETGGSIQGTLVWTSGQRPREVVFWYAGVDVRHNLDRGDAAFELRPIPSGSGHVRVSWYEGDDYHERTLPARAGDTLHFDLTKDAR